MLEYACDLEIGRNSNRLVSVFSSLIFAQNIDHMFLSWENKVEVLNASNFELSQNFRAENEPSQEKHVIDISRQNKETKRLTLCWNQQIENNSRSLYWGLNDLPWPSFEAKWFIVYSGQIRFATSIDNIVKPKLIKCFLIRKDWYASHINDMKYSFD